tara:strand:- start:155 stop:1399 length:1245 start_codon:yes stop_codon:yes gene_type:complete
MKTISLDIKNKEDLEYLESVNYDPDILNTALTIGLKSIQMSQTTMNGNSYIEPLREIIVENNIENSENISKINLMLCDLLNIKNNSSKKGKLGESLAMNSLKKKYPDWKIENTTGTAHESDLFAYSDNYGKILYEIKTYSSNVPSKEIQKFKDDMTTTNSKYGIFVSQTSGIVGKKLIDYEIIDNSILVYISCAGLNGHGIEIGTEFLLSLIDSGYLDRRHLLKNDNIRDVLYEINESMYELNECINNFSRIKMQIDEHRNTMNRSVDMMYRNVVEYSTKANITYDTLLEKIRKHKPVNISLLEENIDFKNIVDTNVLNMNNLIYFEKMYQAKDMKICSDNDNLYIIKNDSLVCKLDIKKNYIDLSFYTKDLDVISINKEYERYTNDMINIRVLDNVFDDDIWKIIEKRLDLYK